MNLIKYLLSVFFGLAMLSATAQPHFNCILIDAEGPVRPWGKCTGDLNNDGRTDLIVGGYTRGGLVYYENPYWEKRIISEESGFSTDIEVHDVDGDMDLFGANHNDRLIRLWVNQHTGNLSVRGYARERNLLTGTYSLEDIQEHMIPPGKWKPFPGGGEREIWGQFSGEITDHSIRKGEQAMEYSWSPLPATLFMEFARTGNRSHYEKEYFGRRHSLEDLVMAELMEGKGRFVDQIVNGIWALCEESYWGVPAHLYLQEAGRGLPDVSEPTVDLFAAETGALLAWTVYLLEEQLDSVSPLICRRVRLEARRRILDPCLERNDFWWMGLIPLHRAGVGLERLNNWSPWIDSNWLTTVLLLEDDPDRRVRSIYKILRCIDQYLNPYPADGGCDEGPNYWGHAAGSLFDCLELLYDASGGKINIFDRPLIGEMGRYIYRVHICDDYYINFADASAVVQVDPGLVFRYGERIGDKKMMAFAKDAAARQHYGDPEIPGNMYRQMQGLFCLNRLRSTTLSDYRVQDIWLPEVQVMAARSGKNAKSDFYVAAKGGHNHESHNHNDVGNFIVYLDGQPVLIDVGVGTYTKKTFGPRRYEIWTMQSAFHNLPTINGVMQNNGLDFKAENVRYESSQRNAMFALNMARAYPQEAEVRSYRRSIVLNRGKSVELSDHYILKEWKEPVLLHLMTPMEVDTNEEGEVILTGRENGLEPVHIYYEADKLSASAETIKIEDKKLQNVWGDELTRIILQVRSEAPEDEIKIIIIDHE
ncbi:MAG: heparinase II/III family protein [Bacteroidales bacterium]